MTTASSAPDSSQRPVAVAMVVNGLLASVCWWLTREYADERGGVWFHLLFGAVGVGNLVVGVMLGIDGRRWHTSARNYALLLALAGFIVPSFTGPSVYSLTFVGGLAFALLLWGNPKKVRTIAGFSLVTLGTLMVFVDSMHLLGRPALHGLPAVFQLMLVDDEIDLLASQPVLLPGMSVRGAPTSG